MRRTNVRPFRRVAGLVAALAAVATVLVAGASPAAADVCSNDVLGHAYLTQPGSVYFSGYNGDQRFGIRTVVVEQGEQFRVGGNGIKAATEISFLATKSDGSGINFLNNVHEYETQPARDNCVVHEEGPYRVTAPPGLYRITATYAPRNSAVPGGPPPTGVVDQVVNVEVRRGPQSADVSQSSTNSMMSTVVSDPGDGGGGDPGGGCDPRRPCPL